MTRLAYYYDSSKCIGCRGCQAACKQWNEEKMVKTKFQTGYQNPPALDADTRMIIKYYENINPGDNPVNLSFLKYQCYHCGEAACVKVCPSGCLSKTESGITDAAKDKCIACGYCYSACPFNIPMIGQTVNKCDMCRSRMENGSEQDRTSIPACVKSCPADAMEFGDREALLAKARKRVDWLKGRGYNDANIYGENFLGGLGIISILKYPAEKYGLPVNPSIPLEVTAWKDIFNPLGLLMLAGAAGVSVFHYLLQRGSSKNAGHQSPEQSTGGNVT